MNTDVGRQWSVFYAYTAWSVVGVLVMLPLGVALFAGTGIPTAFAAQPLPTSLLILQIALGAWSGWRALAAWSKADAPTARDRWDLPPVGRLRSGPSLLVTAAISLVFALLVLTARADELLLVISLSLLITTAFMRWSWVWSVPAAASVAVVSLLLGEPTQVAVFSGSLVLGAVLTIRVSLWLAAMVRELDDTRQAQFQLAVAEERLRFARDLHDVTGRDLSVIAVKSELVAQLAEREDPRAVEHGREVAQIARTSLAEIRALVRGYREADLATELRGTISLLQSAHAEVQVEGSAEDVPAVHAERAAWVLREGGTNILRHADPHTVTMRLTRDGITLVNDGAPISAGIVEGAGLTGMRERLGERSTLTTRLDEGCFTLDVRFDAPGGTR